MALKRTKGWSEDKFKEKQQELFMMQPMESEKIY